MRNGVHKGTGHENKALQKDLLSEELKAGKQVSNQGQEIKAKFF